MLKVYNPPALAAPTGPYSHGVEAPAGARWLHITGQIAVRPDGTIPASMEEQTELVWQNIGAILAEAGMGMSDIVKISSFLVKREDVAKFGPIRARHLAGHKPASTLLIVAALARPELLVEVEAVAAKV
jgi:2-iminobutanoate/2-iminopropanoate deaminase